MTLLDHPPSLPFDRLNRSRPRAWLRYALSRFPKLFCALMRWSGRSPEFQAISGLAPRGGVVLDVGANDGEFALLFSYLAGRLGVVRAFEPVPTTLRQLRFRLASEGFVDNVAVIPAACGDRDGEVQIFVPVGDPGQASLRTHSQGSWGKVHNSAPAAYSVPMLRLDTFWKTASLTRCDLLKCDVEGAELLVLRGARELLQAHRPVLLLESFDAWSLSFGYTRRDLVQFAATLGYDRLFVIRSTIEEVIEQITLDDSGCCNLVFLNQGLHSFQVRHLQRLERRTGSP